MGVYEDIQNMERLGNRLRWSGIVSGFLYIFEKHSQEPEEYVEALAVALLKARMTMADVVRITGVPEERLRKIMDKKSSEGDQRRG